MKQTVNNRHQQIGAFLSVARLLAECDWGLKNQFAYQFQVKPARLNNISAMRPLMCRLP